MVEDVQCLVNRHYDITAIVLTQGYSKLTNGLSKTEADYFIIMHDIVQVHMYNNNNTILA